MLFNRILLFGVFFVVLLINHGHCAAKTIHLCEQPSSCGNLVNITYPFRLEGDPQHCGDPHYQLTCENNRTILNLYSGKYYVKEINYTDSTIRIADIGLQEDNCSSPPLYHLSVNNFSYEDPYSLSYPYYSKRQQLIFLCCQNPMKSPLYVSTTSCIGGKDSCISSFSSKKAYRYVVFGDMKTSEVGDSCHADLMVMATALKNKTNLSYIDIQQNLVYGVTLEWDPIFCRECKGQGYCLLDNTNHVVNCSDPCNFNRVPSFHCAMTLLSQFAAAVGLYMVHYGLPGLVGLCLAIRLVCGAPCVFIFLIYKWRRRHLSSYDSIEDFLQSHHNLMPIRYSYSEIKKMTTNFKEKLGEGGYGSVYKGMLRSGNFVAIKMLGKSKANGQDFINEVATIGRIHHVNIVRLIGFCADRSKRALVYDFMPHGSLDKYVLSREGNTFLSWQKMYEISLGVARGIEYLHRGCDMQILHFDIKPHNVLLDENFTPKVSDFGLAKLYPTNSNTVSITAARGTIGYIAPELFYKNIGSVSYKSDVYSFGMLLMEMAGKRKNLNKVAAEEENSSQIYFPSCVYNQVLHGNAMEIGGATEEEEKIAKKMVMVALWCIQMNPDSRPPMNKVVEMLEQKVESLTLPPKSSLNSEVTLALDVAGDANQSWSPCTSVESTESISIVANVI